MSKTFRWYDNADPRKTSQKQRQDVKQQGRKAKQGQKDFSLLSLRESHK